MTARLSVCVFGAGSIGLYLGGRLASGGADVCFVGRERIGKALKTDGLTLTHFEKAPITLSPEQFTFAASAGEAAEALSHADVVLVCVKSQDSADAATELAGHIRADALVVSFQNGVSNAPVLRDGLSGTLNDSGAVAGAVVPFNVTQTSPTSWHCGTDGALTVEDTGHAAQAKLLDIFRAADQPAELSSDILAVQWGKLLVNLNNGLNTLWGGTLKSGLMQRDYRKAMALQIEEAHGVLAQAGITPAEFGGVSITKMLKILRLPNFIYGFIMKRVVKIDAAARSSMLDDLEAGKACEIDYLQGEVVSLARKHGVPAPINQAVMEAVKTAFANGTSPKLRGTEIFAMIQTAVISNVLEKAGLGDMEFSIQQGGLRGPKF
ncbi:MAG: 2-dehydropantoate 2-reductase [Maricaulaceae bacterium]